MDKQSKTAENGRVNNHDEPNLGALLAPKLKMGVSFDETARNIDTGRNRFSMSVLVPPNPSSFASNAYSESGSSRRGHGSDSALLKRAMKWRQRAERWQHRRPSTALAREIKAARQLGVIMGAFTVCFFPYFVCFMVVAFCDGCISQTLMTAMTWVGYMNSTMNPILYPLCNMNFRRKFRSMLKVGGAKASDRRGIGALMASVQNHSTRMTAPRTSPSGIQKL